MKILVDMNLTPLWVPFLTEEGIEAVHWSSIGSPDDPDTEIFTYAKNNNFVIFTNDLDFGYILVITHGKKPSIIQARAKFLIPDTIGETVVSTIKMFADDIEAGAIVTIDQRRTSGSKTRVALLPL
jgi:predicted nuclease of predicted toxin-antitoxin system